MRERTFYLLLGIITVLVVLVIMLLFLWGKQRRERKAAVKGNKILFQDYKELKQDYHNMANSYAGLAEKFEVLKENKDKVEKLAYIDYLTELPNRVAFTEMLSNVMMTLRSDEVVTVMDIDIDDFKNINDILGNTYGDQILIDVANRLLDSLDENDYLARIGGNEFGIISQNFTELSEYEEKIKRIHKVFTYPFSLSTRDISVTVSIGVVEAPRDGKSSQVLMKNMNSAMVTAKSSGKNVYLHFDESMNRKLMEKMEMQSDLRKAIDKDEFVVYYQAQIDLDSNSINGFEALVRWNHPIKGIIEPSEFIKVAEETGLIVPIGKKMMLESCKQMKQWQDEGYLRLHMAINLSARQFKDTDLVQTVYDIIEDTGVDPKCLEFEITETIVLDDLGRTIETITLLKELGITFSLDDFGTGYSSMNYLKVLPVDNIKIDKSFMESVMDNNVDKRIIEAMITLAQNLELIVIAEGVEKKEQEQFLKKIHCNKAQGFLYSKPVAKEDAEKLLKHDISLDF